MLTACSQLTEQQRNPDKGEPGADDPTTVAKKEPAYDPGELAGTEWTLTSLNDHDLVKDSKITLDFDGGVGGNAGCNSYDTRKLETDGGVFEVDDILSTATGCWGGVGRQETIYLRMLG
ncbi:MAG: META domain-containing protein [Actinomycetota bacterium]|nr:META domain-containing protein [Actinomycetota bacterium]